MQVVTDAAHESAWITSHRLVSLEPRTLWTLQPRTVRTSSNENNSTAVASQLRNSWLLFL